MRERKNPNEQASFVLTFTLLKQAALVCQILHMYTDLQILHSQLVNIIRNAIGAVLLMMSPLAL